MFLVRRRTFLPLSAFIFCAFTQFFIFAVVLPLCFSGLQMLSRGEKNVVENRFWEQKTANSSRAENYKTENFCAWRFMRVSFMESEVLQPFLEEPNSFELSWATRKKIDNKTRVSRALTHSFPSEAAAYQWNAWFASRFRDIFQQRFKFFFFSVSAVFCVLVQDHLRTLTHKQHIFCVRLGKNSPKRSRNSFRVSSSISVSQWEWQFSTLTDIETTILRSIKTSVREQPSVTWADETAWTCDCDHQLIFLCFAKPSAHVRNEVWILIAYYMAAM